MPRKLTQSYGCDLGLRPATLLNNRLSHRCFLVNFVKFLRTCFLTEDLWWLLLYPMKMVFSDEKLQKVNVALLKKRLWHRCIPVNFVKFLKTPFHRTPLGDCFFIRWKWFFPMKKLQKVNVVRIMYQLLKTNKNSNKDLINRPIKKIK